MGYKDVILFVLLFTFVVYSFGAHLDLGITGFSISNSSNYTAENMSVEFSESSFGIDEVLDGKLNLVLEEGMSPDDKVTIEFRDEEYELTLLELLNQSDYTFEYVTDSYTFDTTTPVNTLAFNFDSAGEDMFAVQLPKYADVKSMDLQIQGQDNSGYPSAVELDIGVQDSVEWYYFGEDVAWKNSYIYPEGLDESSPIITNLKGNETYYCEFVTLPYGDTFKILSKYNQIATGGNLKAIILSPLDGDPTEGFSGLDAETCNLPETQPLDTYQYCEINLDYPISGDVLICIYSDTVPYVNNQPDQTTNLYEIPVDQGTETSSYICPRFSGSNCQESSLYDYFILADSKTYDNELKTSESFDDWLTAPNASLFALWQYVGTAPYYSDPVCEDELCYVPITVSTNSSGKVIVSNLKLVYDYDYLGETTSTAIYPQIGILPEIKTIENMTIDGRKIDFDLSLFNISSDVQGNYQLVLDFDNVRYGSEVVIGTSSSDLQTVVDNLISNLQNWQVGDEAKVMKAFGLDENISSALTQLQNYTDVDSNEGEILALKEILPQSVVWGDEEKLVFDVGIVPDELGNIDANQDKVIIEGNLKKFNLIMQNGDTFEGSLVEKDIEALNSMSDVIAYEVIGKEVVASADDVLEVDSFTILEQDPILKFSLSDLSKGKSDSYSYVIESIDFDLFQTGTFVDMVILIDYVCGDDICDVRLGENADNCSQDCGFNYMLFVWIGLIAILIVGLGGLVYYLYTKGLFKSKKIFKSDKEIDPVVNYIKLAKKKGMSKDQIEKNLLNKGWTKKQVKTAFKLVKD